MIKKNGFTLMELIAAIFILGIIGVIAVPRVLDKYNESKIDALVIQESKLVESASILKLDYCERPVDETHYLNCNKYYHEYSGITNYNSKKVYTHYICTKDLKELGYYSEDLEFSGKKCLGAVIYKLDEKTNAVIDSYSYVKCGAQYTSEKKNNFDEEIYRQCVSADEEDIPVEKPVVVPTKGDEECSHYGAEVIDDREDGKCYCTNCGEWVDCPE